MQLQLVDLTSKEDSFDTAKGPGGRLLPGLLCSAVPDKVRDCPRGPADLNGTGLTKHPVLGGLDRASSAIAPGMALPPASLQSRPIAPNPPPHSALRCRPTSNHPPGLKCNTTNESWKFKSAGGVCGPLSRRRKGSARGDFQGENRGPMVQDVPLARSRSGGFLSEGSPQGRMGHGPRTPPALLNPPVVVGVLDSKILSTITFRTSEEDTVLS